MTTTQQDRIWFYYARETQVGPLRESELRAAIADGSLTDADHVYREGFQDWKLLPEVSELRDAREDANRPTRISQTSGVSGRAQRKGERVPIHERVVAHNASHVATGHISNISVTGLYFETPDSVFALNDEVKITLKEGRGLGKPMHLSGVIVRQSRGDARDAAGYGLELRGVDEAARARILDYIKRHQAS
jgi:hypothetical protein